VEAAVEHEEEEWEKDDHVQARLEALGAHVCQATKPSAPSAACTDISVGLTTTGSSSNFEPTPEPKYQGVVKWFRGSFGWIACAALAKKHQGRDVFLHKLDCDHAPKLADKVSFQLAWDDRGNLKAVQAQITKPPA